MNELAARLALQPVFVETRWEVILRQMQERRYNCIGGGITITPERAKTPAWSDPDMTTTLSIVINAQRTPEIRASADLGGAIVGVQAATTDFDAAIAMRRRGEIRRVAFYPFARVGNAMADLAAGRITALMKVYPVAAWLARQSPGLRIAAQIPDDPQPLGVGFAKSGTRLLAAVNRALADMKRDGAYALLAQKWA